MKLLGDLLLLAVILGLAALSVRHGVDLVRQHRAIAAWSPVAATVETAGVNHRMSGRTSEFWPAIRYTYRADGRDHRSDRVTPASFAASRAWAADIVARFPPGAAAQAFVNPHNGEESFLVGQTSPTTSHYAALPLVAMILPVVWLGQSWGRRVRLGAVVVILALAMAVWTHMIIMGPRGETALYLWPGVNALLLAGAVWFWVRPSSERPGRGRMPSPGQP